MIERTGQAVGSLILGLMVTATGMAEPAAEPAEGLLTRPAIADRRVVKHFDFDERDRGNFDSIPMHWYRHEGSGFPGDLEGRFDRDIGRTAVPSFRLDLDGASLAYHYEGRDIAVRPGSDYLVVAWCRSASLGRARAFVTAHYMDRKGVPVPDTERSSSKVGGSRESSDWIPLTVALPGNVATARYINIALWLTQSRVWDDRPRLPRHIEREDVRATVWFDDVTVYRLPRVELCTSRASNVFGANETVTLHAEVSDPDGLNLVARLAVHHVDGRRIDERVLPIRTDPSEPIPPVTYEELPVGQYVGELTIASDDGTQLGRRRLTFVKLAPSVSPPTDLGRGFGVVLEHVAETLLPGQRDLLAELRPEYVKAPVWNTQQAVLGRPIPLAEIDGCLEMIKTLGGIPVGVTRDDPDRLRGDDGSRVRTMFELFRDDPVSWKPLIAGIWSRYGNMMGVWQMGGDDEGIKVLANRPAEVVPDVRREMATLMARPILALPGPVLEASETPPAGDIEVLYLPASVPPDDIGAALQDHIRTETHRTWVTVEPLPETGYVRTARLADLVRRLAETRFLGPEVVFLRETWSTHVDAFGATVDPREDFIVFRTVSDLLGHTTPVSRTTFGGQASGLVFDRNGQAIILVWDDHAPAEGREYILLLGDEAEQVDLWGRRHRLASAGSRQRVRIGREPTFIINTPTWLIEFRRRFVVDPWVIEASFDAQDREIVFVNTYHEPISGTLRLVMPPEWEVRPNRFAFALQPSEEFRQSIRLRFPRYAEAAITPLVGEFDIDAERRYRVIEPAWFELGLVDIDLNTYVYRQDDRVIISQSLTNRTDRMVSFRGSVIAPDRPRISRQFVNFKPGQSGHKEFVLNDADELAGQRIRVALKELDGSRLWNTLVTVP